ncbi:MAG TPA: endonuclease V [Gaiellales bacterium]|nr:endonuclease V [Gaiellales bacterium]
MAALQREIGAAAAPAWAPPDAPMVAGCFVCFPRGKSGAGAAGDPAVAAAAALREGRVVASVVVRGEAGAPYAPGLLALREGALLAAAVEALGQRPDVVLLDATGRDHPRRVGLAVHVGWALDLPTVGVTHRPLVAEGDWPADAAGAAAPLTVEGEVVGYWLRTRSGTRPLAVHAGWRTSPEAARDLVRSLCRVRTPEPLREARRLARRARAAAPRS